MIKWKVESKDGETAFPIVFDSEGEASEHITRMGEAFHIHYKPVPLTDNEKVKAMLTEGLEAGDYRRILLPKISIDEYLPGDQQTDNVVIAFFISEVPEAVIPFRDFIMKSKDILDTAFSDSETMPNTSVVYAEMNRDKFPFTSLFSLLDQISILSGIKIEDFSLSLPTEKNMIPYSPKAIIQYFKERSIKQNLQAQRLALKKIELKQQKREEKKKKEIQKSKDNDAPPPQPSRDGQRPEQRSEQRPDRGRKPPPVSKITN